MTMGADRLQPPIHLVPSDGLSTSWLTGDAGDVAPALESAALAVIIQLVRSGRASTRPELVTASGLSRKVVTQRVEQALELKLLDEGGLAPSGGGRQARTLRFRSEAGHVFAAFVGASEITTAVSDLDGTLIATHHEDWSVDNGPDATMERIQVHFTKLSRRSGVVRPWGIGIGVPGPVDYSAGRLVAPPIMPGWDGFSARAWFRDRYDAPVWVDNDVNLMALGEWTKGAGVDGRDMLFVKVGTGVGAGSISHGRLIRGQRGAAGDIGHTHVTSDPAAVCRCGRIGCLEAVASGWSILIQATRRAEESPVFTAAIRRSGRIVLGDVSEAVFQNDPLAVELIDNSVAQVAEVVANLVNFANPGLLVVGGGALRAGPRVIEIMSAVVAERSTDLVKQGLEIRAASLDHLEGVTGAALLATENLLALGTLTRWVEDGSPLGHAAALQRYASAFV